MGLKTGSSNIIEEHFIFTRVRETHMRALKLARDQVTKKMRLARLLPLRDNFYLPKADALRITAVFTLHFARNMSGANSIILIRELFDPGRPGIYEDLSPEIDPRSIRSSASAQTQSDPGLARFIRDISTFICFEFVQLNQFFFFFI
ncbi:hypothetical protein PUN28_011435 [Cardiocondyla obscurior]|uniref:Uncharacterized protein n=1 Tax=Cardiocondyla obscurior TaxID=286306 RepID=A0AAW2FGA2_9HYME